MAGIDRAADTRWMNAALALSDRTRGQTAPNPNVGCIIVRDGVVVGRGWTKPGGRPHAEAMALAQAGERARGATAYVTLEPCAHASPRGPACADLLVASGVARVVAAMRDPDPRTDGAGFARLAAAGIAVERDAAPEAAARAMAGFLTRRRFGRPFVTLKLALSLDGASAMADGRSIWITGAQARVHAHLERSRHEAILVGRGTREADAPRLDVRLAGLEARSPARVMLSAGAAHPHHPGHPSGSSDLSRHEQILSPGDPSLRWGDEEGERSGSPAAGAGSGTPDQVRGDDGGSGDAAGEWLTLASPVDIASLPGDHLLVEGGVQTAAAFLAADLVDRLLLYRAPILIGGGRTLPDIALGGLAEAHGRWRLHDARALGSDRLEVYERVREA